MENIEDKAAVIRRSYQKQWRAKHKDRIKEYNRRYWEKKAATRLVEQQKEHDADAKD